MLDLTLNLEADLGIDSIKRVEIVGALQRETGTFESEELEQVAGLKTLQEMIDFLETDRVARACRVPQDEAPQQGPLAAPAASGKAASPPAGTAEVRTEPVGNVLLRLVSDKTGYPTEMLDLTLNLEADLGIDSIKRVEIVGALQRETGAFGSEELEQVAGLKTLQEMIDFLETDREAQGCKLPAEQVTGSGSEQAEAHRAPSLPFIGRVVSSVAGEEVVVLREIDLDEDIFLRHHTLGGQVSAADQGLMALPVMPLTMSMEMLAEAAALLVPNRVVVGMRDIRAHRWVTFHEHRLLLQMVARRQSPDEVRVELREAGDPAPARATVTPIVEGIVLFANEYPDPPQGRGLSLRSEHASRWAPEQLYTEGMFHGPSFQGVISLDRWGEDGAEATLQALPDGQLFRSEPHPTFLIDPVLLDAAGQLVGYWAAECLEAGFNVFPFRVEALHLYGPALPAPQRARCQARISLLGDTRVQSDIDVVASDGKMRMQLVGWEDRRFELPEAFYQVRLSPREALLSTPWPTPVARFPAPQTFECCLLQGLPDDFLSGHGMIWQRVLAHLILSRQERETWRGLKGPAKRRSEWLLGRAVAKDAVRLYLRRRRGMELYPADIEIESDEHGRPLAQGAWAAALEDVPALSLAHSGGVAVAIAGDSSLGIGVDIERLGRASLEEIEGLAFTHEERDLLASMGDSEREEWALRLWCAKEAAAKALGRGMVGGPLGLVACEPDIQSGMVRVALAGKMAGLFPELEGRPITAYTAREGGLVVAAALVMRGT
jgi:phosphopantetheinyl transferase/acyl carrier protein